MLPFPARSLQYLPSTSRMLGSCCSYGHTGSSGLGSMSPILPPFPMQRCQNGYCYMWGWAVPHGNGTLSGQSLQGEVYLNLCYLSSWCRCMWTHTMGLCPERLGFDSCRRCQRHHFPNPIHSSPVPITTPCHSPLLFFCISPATFPLSAVSSCRSRAWQECCLGAALQGEEVLWWQPAQLELGN